MRSTRTFATVAVSVLLLVATGQTGAVARPAPGPKWHVQSTPTFDASSILYSVTTLRATETWAVGSAEDHQQVRRTLIEHFDGAAWTRQVSPDPGPPDDVLIGVKAVSSSNVWAVGQYSPSGGGIAGMILHYDGTMWGISELQPDAAYFTAVAVHGGGDTWAVGASQSDRSTYIEHFDGATWTRQPTPGRSGDDLRAVSASSSSNVWAVGARLSGSSARPLILHDGGSGWHIQSAPSLPGEGVLTGVSANSANDVWAVGWYIAGGATYALILHWDGNAWTQFPPPVDGTLGMLQSVKAVSSDDVWAVGTQQKNGSTKTLIEHWNGANWKVVASPNGGGNTSLLGVASSGPNNSFAVGYIGIQSKAKTFAVHCAC